MIQTIGYNGKILNVRPNAGAVQGHYSIIFKTLATVQQRICNSVCLSFQFHAHCSIWLSHLVLHHRLNLSLSSLAFYGTLQPPLSFANLCDTRVANKCNNKEPEQNKVTTWNSFNWYLRKIIQYPNYKEKGEIVKRTYLEI